MSANQKMEGYVTHANGTFEFKLKGADRAQAHAEIMKLTDPFLRASKASIAADLAIAAIIRTDPSLLLEPLPDRCQATRDNADTRANSAIVGRSRTPINSDTIWKKHAELYGTWLAKMVCQEVEYMHTVQAALDLGIHPDDESVWPNKRLLSTVYWVGMPERLSMALIHGASPNRGAEWDDAYLRRVLSGIRGNLTGTNGPRTVDSIVDLVRCAELLLDAGATETEPLAPNKQFLTAIGYLVDFGNSVDVVDPHIRTIVNELMERLHEAKADIDCRNGVMALPPVIYALRCLNIEGACQLIRMGCKTDDAHIVRTSGLGGIINPLMDEAHEAGQEAFTTRIIAAVMQRQLLLSNARAPEPSTNESNPKARRRRMAV